MEVGVLGLGASGKTTLFNLLCGNGHGADRGVRRGTAARGVARVPAPRLDRLS